MALVNCPECGRENVSNNAEMCPTCGYGIKAYFKKIEEEKRVKIEKIENEKKRKLLEEEKAKKREESLRRYNEELQKEIERINDMPYPEKPTFFGTMFGSDKIATQLYVGILIGSLLLAFVTKSMLFAFIFALDLVLGTIGLIILIYADYDIEMHSYKYVTEKSREWNDFNGYKEYLIKQKTEYYSDKDNIDRENQIQINRIRTIDNSSSNMSKCPMCQSTNIEKISTTSRAVSVAMVGLASGKIGKQYKCKNCKHMW